MKKQTLSSSSLKLYSHPEKKLYEHLSNVQYLIEVMLENCLLNTNIPPEKLKKLARIMAVSHDFGKATAYFQDRLFERERTKKELTHHSFLSALFAFYIAKKLNIKEAIIPFITVLSHHGRLPKIHPQIDIDISPIHKRQLESIDFKELELIYTDFLCEDGIKINFEEFKKEINNDSDLIEELWDEIDEYPENIQDIETFMIIQFLFSLLIDADKLDAGINDLEQIKKIAYNIKIFNKTAFLVDKYKSSPDALKDSAINKLREEIYQQTSNFDFNLDKKIYSINVPTGTGKTFASLNFAFKLKEKLNFNPKIIYCLPFTSIIDQNYSVIEDILKTNGEEITSEKLLKHHHLAEIEYKVGIDDEYETLETDKSLLLTENWMSSIVVTTFVQFFHSLISNRNRSLKKFHNIANSIVILDEIQAVPYKYWKLINEVLTEFSRVFNTYFILVTATQPLIFENIEEVIKNKQKYFESPELDRITLNTENLKQNICLADFKKVLIKDITEENPDKSFLIILNTIKSSQDVFNHLHQELDKEKVELKYLSTTVLPYERSEIIKEIKDERKLDKRYVIISTQVVEAGVDIDLDIVYRDLAPLDCIFQSAGRCNRNKKNNEPGIVKIFHLVNENHNNKPFAEYIYEPILLDSTKTILKLKDEFKEKEFFSLANDYYEKVNEKKSNEPSRNILNAMKNLDFEKVKEFQLIENSQTQDFFIELSPQASAIKEKVKNIIETKKGFERKNALLECKKEFYKYVVSVRLKKNQKFDFSESRYQELEGSPIVIPNNEVEKYYKSVGIGLTFDESDKDFDSGIMII